MVKESDNRYSCGRRLLVVIFAAALAILVSAAVWSADAVKADGATVHQASEPVSDLRLEADALPVHHYSEHSQGSGTLIDIAENREGDGMVQPFAVSWVPFDWTIDFDSTLRGRDMKSSTGGFCQRFKATYRQIAAIDHIRITLVRNRTLWPDVRYDTKGFRADGQWSVRKCWPRYDPSATYHFDYQVQAGMIGYDVRGHGRARGH